jgi:hypothetical protein
LENGKNGNGREMGQGIKYAQSRIQWEKQKNGKRKEGKNIKGVQISVAVLKEVFFAQSELKLFLCSLISNNH